MKKSPSKIIFDICNYLFLGTFVAICLYPILNQVAISFSSPAAIMSGKVTVYPMEFTTATYEGLIQQPIFWRNYQNSIMYTFLGIVLSLIMTTIASYALSKKDLFGGNVIMKFFVFTIFFGGGIIPCYALIIKLGLIDNILAILLPNVILPYHVLIMRTYFQGIPVDLEEASKLDGLGQFGYFIQIILPLSKPILATMTLFIAVLYWNDWFSALMYLNDQNMQPVTLYLRNAMMGSAMAASTGDVSSGMQTIPQSLQAASMLLVIAPILCVYPFVQKYFVKGVMIGAVKG
ncbi:MAG: carbohydrate ABC transporter permease [Bacillota bacterium]